MLRKKVGWPVIAVAVAALCGLLYSLGKTFLAEPYSIHTAPPPWIDAVTGKPKRAVTGSSGDTANAAQDSAANAGQKRPAAGR